MFNEKYDRQPYSRSLPAYTCGLSGKSYSAEDVRQRADHLARAISKELGWEANTGTEYDKVACIYSVNNVDYHTVSWAVHRVGGIATPANAGYNAEELAYQLKASGATVMFTSVANLKVALEAAKQVNIASNKIFLYEIAPQAAGGKETPPEFKTVDQLIQTGSKLPNAKPIQLSEGAGKTRTAFLCFSSGTSGLPKGVMISHYNVIANVIGAHSHEVPYRKYLAEQAGGKEHREVKMGLLPDSHIYALTLISHQSFYRGDHVIVLPGFSLNTFLECTQKYKITLLPVVPPIIIALTKNQEKVAKYDLSSVKCLMCGAAPLGKETGDELQKMFPKWLIRQAYGMTETSPLSTNTPYDDIVSGSIGVLIPGVSAKVMDPVTLKEITEYGQPGELWVRGPSCAMGYLNNKQATEETFITDSDGYWVRTGDEVKVQKSPKGQEHIFVLDRIKELIKVKGHQVAPAELEAALLTHHAVDDCCVISIPDDRAGERPKAFIVKSKTVGLEENDRMVKRDIQKHIEKSKSDYKWIKEIEFVDVIPKSPSGKILRRMLRDKDKEQRRKKGAKL